jgi:TRAP-type transport system small permease protein
VTAGLRRAVEHACAALMVGITGIVFFQVVTRYVFRHPFDWPEELARYLFVWVALLGAAVGVERGVHFSVDLLTVRLPRGAALRVAAALDAVFAGFAALLAWQGVLLVWAVREQPSAGLEISMAWPYAAIPTAAVLMAASLVRSALRRWQGARGGAAP